MFVSRGVFLVAALAACASLSSAGVLLSFGGATCAGGSAGLCSSVLGATTVSFDSLAGSALPYSDGFATYSSSGSGSPFVNGSVWAEYAAPTSGSLLDTTDYLTVGSPRRPGTVTIDFLMPIKYFGLYMGSPDTYNSISFYGPGQNPKLLGSFTGDQLIAPGNGDQSVADYVNFNIIGDGGASQIVMSSSLAALETDNHAYAPVPEPATFALLGAGLLVVGLVRRKRTN